MIECSFCGKNPDSASLIIRGGKDFAICGNCVLTCADMILRETKMGYKELELQNPVEEPTYLTKAAQAILAEAKVTCGAELCYSTHTNKFYVLSKLEILEEGGIAISINEQRRLPNDAVLAFHEKVQANKNKIINRQPRV